jgi:hypothetical protein
VGFFLDENLKSPGINQVELALFRGRKRWKTGEWVLYWIPLLAAGVVAYLHFTAPPPSISRDNYERVEAGMTEREVERIIGTRPGGYEVFYGPGDRLSQEWADPEGVVRWGNGYGILSVGYNAEGRVCTKQLEYNSHSVPEHPELWPWWKRLFNRSVPERKPDIVYSPF